MTISKVRRSRLTPAERKQNARIAAAQRWGNAANVNEPSGNDHREPREAVLLAAARLFGSRGYGGPSIQDIADTAGVGMPTIYRFFPNKRSLYVECCRRVFDRYSDYFGRLLTKNPDPAARIYGFVLGDCFISVHPDRTRLFHRAVVEEETEVIEAMFKTGAFGSYFRLLEENVRLLLPDADPQQKCVSLLALVFGLATFRPMLDILPALPPLFDDIDALARMALSTIFPMIDWAAVRERVQFQPFDLDAEIVS